MKNEDEHSTFLFFLLFYFMSSEFTFIRYRVQGIYFKDLGIAVSNGEKFDIYENGVLAGTLIDDDSTVIGMFRNSKTITRKKKSFFAIPYTFEMMDDNGQSFAKGETDPDSHKYLICFTDQAITYNLRVQSNRSSYSKYRITAEFHIGENIYCQINYKPFPEGGWFRKNFGSSEFKGVIHFAEGLNQDYLLGFLLLLNRKTALDGPRLG